MDDQIAAAKNADLFKMLQLKYNNIIDYFPIFTSQFGCATPLILAATAKTHFLRQKSYVGSFNFLFTDAKEKVKQWDRHHRVADLSYVILNSKEDKRLLEICIAKVFCHHDEEEKERVNSPQDEA